MPTSPWTSNNIGPCESARHEWPGCDTRIESSHISFDKIQFSTLCYVLPGLVVHALCTVKVAYRFCHLWSWTHIQVVLFDCLFNFNLHVTFLNMFVYVVTINKYIVFVIVIVVCFRVCAHSTIIQLVKHTEIPVTNHFRTSVILQLRFIINFFFISFILM